MPTFEYIPIAETPGASPKVIEAPDRAAAVRLLRSRGITPSRVAPVEVAPSGHAPHGHRPTAGIGANPFARPAMSRVEFASFIREVATATQAGLTVVQALRTVARQRRKVRQRRMLDAIISDVEHGRSLAEAAESWGAPFDDLTIGLMRAGEASGNLEEVLDQAALLLDRQVELRRSILSATTYPAILLVLATVGVVVVTTVIVPKILGPLEGELSASDLPMPTRIVKGFADGVGSYWWAILLVVVFTIIMARRLYADPPTRLVIDRTLLRVPVLGPLLRDVAVARFTRTLATLVSSGLPALSAMRITRNTLGNRALERAVETVCDEVAGGKTIAEPLEAVGYFPPLLVQIVGVGRRSGRLPSMLQQAADAFERRTEASIKVFAAVLPPLMIVVLSIVVGFLIAAVLLPLLELQDAIPT